MATLADLEWADGIAFGTPARFGNVAALTDALRAGTASRSRACRERQQSKVRVLHGLLLPQSPGLIRAGFRRRTALSN